MRKAIIPIILGILATFSGCASMWNTLGVATTASVQEDSSRAAAREQALREENEALKAQVQELSARVDRMSARMDDFEDSSADLDRIEALVDDLRDRVDLIPEETLQKLADILSKAARSSRAARPAIEGGEEAD